jgi:hypothetical protein
MLPLRRIGRIMPPMNALGRLIDRCVRRYSIHRRKHEPPYMQRCTILSMPGMVSISVCGGLKNDKYRMITTTNIVKGYFFK